MSNKSQLQTNNIDLQSILSTVLGLPTQESCKTGLYAWKKYNYVPEQTVNFDNVTITATRPDTSSVVFASNDFDITSIRDLSFFDGLTCGTPPYTLEFEVDRTGKLKVEKNGNILGYGSWDYTNGKMHLFVYSIDSAQTSYGAGTLNVTGSKTISGYKTDLIGHVVSDSSNAYPDKSTKGEYWYEISERVDLLAACGCNKIAVDRITPTTDTELSDFAFSHSLGQNPYIAIIMVPIIGQLNNRLVGAAYMGFAENGETSKPTAVSQYYGGYIESGDVTVTDTEIKINAGPGYKVSAGVEYTVITLCINSTNAQNQ